MNAKTVAMLAFLGLAFSSSAVAARERIYYFHNDHLGTPQVMTDQAGRVVWQAEYAPFGKATLNQDPDGDGQQVINNLRFPGQYYDDETGLHYNYHRDYDPETGRYLTPDPIGQAGGPNIYAYAGGNPLKNIDPEGLDYWVEGAVEGEGGMGFHQSLCVGSPTGQQYCISFGVDDPDCATGLTGCKGKVYQDRSKPGPFVKDKYRYTSSEVDKKIQNQLASMVGTPGDYFLLQNDCRAFVSRMFNLLVNMYGGSVNNPQPSPPNPKASKP